MEERMKTMADQIGEFVRLMREQLEQNRRLEAMIQNINGGIPNPNRGEGKANGHNADNVFDEMSRNEFEVGERVKEENGQGAIHQVFDEISEPNLCLSSTQIVESDDAHLSNTLPIPEFILEMARTAETTRENQESTYENQSFDIMPELVAQGDASQAICDIDEDTPSEVLDTLPVPTFIMEMAQTEATADHNSFEAAETNDDAQDVMPRDFDEERGSNFQVKTKTFIVSNETPFLKIVENVVGSLLVTIIGWFMGISSSMASSVRFCNMKCSELGIISSQYKCFDPGINVIKLVNRLNATLEDKGDFWEREEKVLVKYAYKSTNVVIFWFEGRFGSTNQNVAVFKYTFDPGGLHFQCDDMDCHCSVGFDEVGSDGKITLLRKTMSNEKYARYHFESSCDTLIILQLCSFVFDPGKLIYKHFKVGLFRTKASVIIWVFDPGGSGELSWVAQANFMNHISRELMASPDLVKVELQAEGHLVSRGCQSRHSRLISAINKIIHTEEVRWLWRHVLRAHKWVLCLLFECFFVDTILIFDPGGDCACFFKVLARMSIGLTSRVSYLLLPPQLCGLQRHDDTIFVFDPGGLRNYVQLFWFLFLNDTLVSPCHKILAILEDKDHFERRVLIHVKLVEG